MSRSRVVFVGNIPYDMTEEQLVDIFKEVGPVVSFRLMFDRETGKARGYGFCEYADAETAASAIRNLNGYDIGGRTLKVNQADQDIGEQYRTPVTASTAGGGPSSTQLLSGTPSIDVINATLSSMSNAQLVEVLSQMKTMAVSNPEQTRRLLHENPSLTFAIFQSMVMMNLIDPAIVQQIMNSATGGGHMTGQPNAPTSSLASPPLVSTSAPPPHPSSGQPAVEQQRALIMQIMSLTPEQINALPPGQREQCRRRGSSPKEPIMAVRYQLCPPSPGYYDMLDSHAQQEDNRANSVK